MGGLESDHCRKQVIAQVRASSSPFFVPMSELGDITRIIHYFRLAGYSFNVERAPENRAAADFWLTNSP